MGALVLAAAVGAATALWLSPSVSACRVDAVADAVLPSVVTISAAGRGGSGTGSGEVVRADGHILTNNHVISPAANGGTVQVLFSDGEAVPATIVGRDPLTDLAVLRVVPPRPLAVIEFGSSAGVGVGDPVVALGAPLGLSGTVTSGIVSAQDRTVQVPGDGGRSALLVSALQTDAAINPGNSGGALVDCDGRIVGVPTAGATAPGSTGSVGLGFAIPFDFARTIADEIIATGRVTHATFGIQVTPIPPSAADQAGVAAGLFVAATTPNGPSDRAGIRPGDVITAVDGAPAQSVDQLSSLTITRSPGEAVGLAVERDGSQRNADVVLGAATS
ncbi:S1C family serine protease [Pseudonocardia endophytica]|uniref:S1C family serine protease n=1 Tax=Pseudonocardia endophytica TaxID=401976 RepID=UPI001404D14C|nr:trypsin-like peptidase domain-containing protein [Pseudonocardia endophytica]